MISNVGNYKAAFGELIGFGGGNAVGIYGFKTADQAVKKMGNSGSESREIHPFLGLINVLKSNSKECFFQY